MNLKSNIINNAIAGFINMFKSGSRSFIVKRLSAFLLSLIIFVSSVFCQYCTALVSAAEVGAIVAVDLIVELAVTGGIVAGIIRGAQILQGEIDSGYGFGSSGLDDYANSVNQQLIDGVNVGNISNLQAGSVKKLSGVPVEIICPACGIYQFLCTNELCNKIRLENPQTEEGLKQIVSSYWSSVNILDQRTFEEIASDSKNWILNLDQLNTIGRSIIAQSVFDGYGKIFSEPNPSFFETGLWLKYFYSNRWYEQKINPSTLNQYESDSFCVLTWESFMGNDPVVMYSLYGHLLTESDPTKYKQIQGVYFYKNQNINVELNGLFLKEVTQSLIGASNGVAPDTLDFDEIFPNWGDLWGIESTDALDLIDWCLGDSRFWNTDIIDLAVDEIADAVDAKVDTGDDAVSDPLDLPIDIPIEGVGDVAFPGTDTEEDFDDPPAYPRTDEWADVDATDWPTFDPDPDVPDPDDPDPDDPDSPPVDPDGELPPLAVPQLLTLFPFCIPFDIHKALMFFETDISEGGSPEFRIPFRIILPNNQSIIYDDIVINFDGYDIPLILYYIKAALVVTHCIVLGYATTKFIY